MPETNRKRTDAEEDSARKLEAVTQGKEQINLNQQEVGVSIEKTKQEYESLKSNIEKASTALGKAYWLLDLVGWLAPIGSLIAYYAIYFYYSLPSAFAYGGLEIALPIALILRLLVWVVRLQLRAEDISFTEGVKESIGGFIGGRFRINFQATRLDERLSRMWNYAGRMISAVRSYVPGLDQYYDGQERIRGQRSFIKTLRNALNEYGFQLRGKVESYLAEFGPLTDTELQWVEKASMDLSLIYGMPQVIFKLVYADYVNDDTERKNAWTEIRNDGKVFHSFVKMILDSGRVPTEYVERDLESYGGIEELIAKVNPFSLSSFLAVYNIQYYEFAEEKDALIDAVNAYHLRITTNTAGKIKRFPPSSFEGKERLKELFTFSSVQLTVHPKILELLFYERQGLGSSRQKAWAYLKKSEESAEVDRGTALSEEGPKPEDKKLLSCFVALLVDRNLLDVPTAYSEAKEDVVKYIVRALQPFDDFTITRGQMKVLQCFMALESEKDSFLRTISSNNISLGEGDRKEFTKMLPVGNALTEILQWLVEHTKVPEKVLLLFYYDYTAQVRKRDDYFGELKKDNNGELVTLARELLSRKIISVHGSYEGDEEENISNLASYLYIAPKYDRIVIESVFSEYSRLFRYSKLILKFLKDQKICREDSEVSFGKLLNEIAQPHVDFLDQLRLATELKIREFSLPSFHPRDWLEPIALATVTAFLVYQREDMFLSNIACRRAASVERAAKILYEYSWMNDEEQHKSQANRTPFAAIIERAMRGTDSHTEYFSEFQRGLTSGFLFRRISDIPLTRLRHIDDQVSTVVSQMEYEAKLKSHLQALGTFLQSELKSGIIMESLKMQLVAAYAITIPTEADVITGVIDNLLPNICAEMAIRDPIYKEIFIKAETKETSIGRYTRIGVVPYNMGFNDFADRLRRAYRTAVSRYEESGKMGHEVEKYVANVIRIFPTSAYFKQLEPFENASGKGADDFLADLIRPLMLKKFGSVKSAEILASLKTSEEEEVAMRSVLAALYDTSSALYMIAQKEFDGVTSSPTLKEYIKLGKFDMDLASAFEEKRLSELAVTVYRSAKGGTNQETAVKQNLTKRITQICDAIRARPATGEIDSVSTVVFQALYDIGMILDGLSA